MHNEKDICEKILVIYPELGKCGVDVQVDYDKKKESLVVHLKKDAHSLDHYLSADDANLCVEGKQCISLGLEIAQMVKNIEGKQF